MLPALGTVPHALQARVGPTFYCSGTKEPMLWGKAPVCLTQCNILLSSYLFLPSFLSFYLTFISIFFFLIFFFLPAHALPSPALVPGSFCYFMSYVLTTLHSLRYNFLSYLLWTRGCFRLCVGWRHLSHSSLWTQAEVDTLLSLMCSEKKKMKWETSAMAQWVNTHSPQAWFMIPRARVLASEPA